MTPRSSCPGGESTPLQGANLRLNYEINNVTDTALGNLARGKPSFCRSDRCLSYRPPGSLLESRGGSILARAEASLPKHDQPCRDGCGGRRQVREVCCRRIPDGYVRPDPGPGRENEGDDVRPAGPDVHAGPDAGRTQAHGRGK